METAQKLKYFIYIGLGIILIVVIFLWQFYSLGVQRDYQTLAEMKIVQGQLIQYYLKNYSFQLPKCENGDLVNDCFANLFNISDLSDHIKNSSYQYRIENLGADNFAVKFYLEQGVSGIGRGSHLMTKEGIK